MLLNSLGVAVRLLFFVLTLVCSSTHLSDASARLPSDAPRLPSPDPGIYVVINVGTAQALVDAAWHLQDNQAILIAPGIYDLTSVSSPASLRGIHLGTTSGPPLNNVQIRGETGDPEDVQILGGGMLDPSVYSGIRIYGATDVTIADLTVGQVYYHAIEVLGSLGASEIQLYHCNFIDTGLPLVKINSGAGSAPSGMHISYCDFRFSAGAPIHPELGYVQTGGVDALTTDGLWVSDCYFEGIYALDGSIAAPAVMARLNSIATTVERSTFLDCTRGIALGLLGGDHQGGIIRNNFLRSDLSAMADLPISCASAGATIVHNTIFTNGNFSAVEVRYESTADVELRHNLMDAGISLRNGATATIADNITTAHPSWFVDEGSGDLHLSAEAAASVDQVSVLASASDDFDALPRPATLGQVDIGASEYVDPATNVPGIASMDYRLHSCVPNPFNPSTTITYSIPQAGHVELEIYDLAGRHVSTLVSEHVDMGEHQVHWSGNDDTGAQVASGVYLNQLRAGDFVETKRMVLLK